MLALPSTLEGTRQAVYAELDTVARQSKGDFAKMAQLLKHGPQPELSPAAFAPLAAAAAPMVLRPLLVLFGSFALVAKVQQEYSKTNPTVGSRSSSTRDEFAGLPPMMQLHASVLGGLVNSYVAHDNPVPANSKDFGAERPKLPIRTEYPIHEGEWLNNLINPAHIGKEYDTSVLPGKSLDGAGVDTRPLFTPVYDGERATNMFREKRHIRRHECSNGLVYEDAPYHGTKDSYNKNRAPTDPKTAAETSVKVKETSDTRLSYDKRNKEIVILMEHGENIVHGHVRKWSELKQEHKNVLIKHFDFTPGGKAPQNRNKG